MDSAIISLVFCNGNAPLGCLPPLRVNYSNEINLKFSGRYKVVSENRFMGLKACLKILYSKIKV